MIAFVVALLKLAITGDTEIFKTLVDATFDSSKMAVMDISLPLAGVMTLWLGLMNIGEKAGAINFLSRIVGPFFNKLFPEIPKGHPANGHIMMNFSANMLGLGNAATPLGLKAMDSMQELNPNKDTASNAVKVGFIIGPIGALAGSVPGVVLGWTFGKNLGNQFDRPTCPKCGTRFYLPENIR